MTPKGGKALLLAGTSAGALILALTAGAWAQDTTTSPVETTPSAVPEGAATEAPAEETPAPEAESGVSGEEVIVVTGSRLRRSTFNSIAPLQVIDGETSREAGLTETDEMLQSLTVASGFQIDSAVSSNFVTDSGPGSSTLGLRNLDPERTLILVNGRRLAPAGVEGAPINPDLNLVPGSMIDRIEVLLDGASSIYGSDAVAGVANVILRKDFDGLELDIFRDFSTDAGGNGETTELSATWGMNSDRGYVGIGVEYSEREALHLGDRPFGERCERNYEYDPATGQIFTGDPRRDGLDCYTFGASGGWISTPLANLYYVPGVNPGSPTGYVNPYGINDFTTSGRSFPGIERVPLGTGAPQYRSYPEDRLADMEPELTTTSIFGSGEYDLGIGDNITAFFEASYNSREANVKSTPAQLFPVVPYTNAFNPFGFAGPGFGDVRPVLLIPGDRDNVDISLSQTRLLFGLRGDFTPMDDLFGLSDWAFEIVGGYTKSHGTTRRLGIINSRLELSINTSTLDPDSGQVFCGADTDADGEPGADTDLDGIPDTFIEPIACVPVNLFSDSVLSGNGFETQEETDYLFGVRSYITENEQTLFNAAIDGSLFELQGGNAGAVIGMEYRKDELDSQPDEVARLGDFFGFVSDQGAQGSADLWEVFAEVELPLLADLDWAKELTFNASARFTEQQYYGANWTYSLKALYAPTDWLKFRGTFGTSFRAPNLREFFLAGQTGFASGFGDPCVVPGAALDPDGPDPDSLPDYNAANDTRDPTILAACLDDGVDPTSLGLSGVEDIEVITGGTTDLEAETSEAFSAGFVVDQPFFDDFTLRFGATYYEIEVNESIEEPTTSFILGQCYDDGDGLANSAFCDRIIRGPDGFIDLLDSSFINVGVLRSRGFDLNLLFGTEIEAMGELFDFQVDVTATKTLESFVEILGDEEDSVGTIGTPEWRGLLNAQLGWSEFRFLWRTQFIGAQEQKPEDVEGAFETCPLNNPAVASTARDPACLASRFAKDFVEDYYVHSMSLTWQPDTWALTVGVENVFNTDPELVDGDTSWATNGANVPVGIGYDTLGRTVFVNVSKSF